MTAPSPSPVLGPHPLQNTIDDLPFMMWIIGLDGSLLSVNRRWSAFTGRGLEETRGRGWRKDIHPADLTRGLAAFRAAVAAERPFAIDARVRRHDDRFRWLLHSGAPHSSATGSTACYIGTSVDITDVPDSAAVRGQGARRGALERLETDERARAAEDRFRQFAAAVQTAREAERTELARELHDELGQTLTALKFELMHAIRDLLKGAGMDPRLIDRLQSIGGNIELATEWTRRVATELRPPALDHLGLVAALEFESAALSRRTGLRCHVTASAIDYPLSTAQKTAVFRIVQQALTNTVRHAHASTVRITFTQKGGTVVVKVQDNGRGITADELANPLSIGLLGMRERAELAGGSVDITSRPGRGTTVRISMAVEA